MMGAIKNNPKSSISIGTVIAILALMAAIWRFDDRYAKAGSVDQIQLSIESMKTVQSKSIKKLDKHLDFEKQQAIYDLEDRIEDIDKKEGANLASPDDIAKRKKLERRLEALMDN